jgi:hypothetical protein
MGEVLVRRINFDRPDGDNLCDKQLCGGSICEFNLSGCPDNDIGRDVGRSHLPFDLTFPFEEKIFREEDAF